MCCFLFSDFFINIFYMYCVLTVPVKHFSTHLTDIVCHFYSILPQMPLRFAWLLISVNAKTSKKPSQEVEFEVNCLSRRTDAWLGALPVNSRCVHVFMFLYLQ